MVLIVSVLLSKPDVADAARDYVPPPNGPYQSTVVIDNTASGQSDHQVYKFPPPDILMDEKLPQNKLDRPPLNRPQADSMPYPDSAAVPQPAQQPAMDYPSAGYTNPNQPPANQWQVTPGVQPGAYPGNWYGGNGYPAPNSGYNQNQWQQAPGYGYQQQYPYSYGNTYPYNGTNSTFNGMPSPWSVMPKNPFFSDK